MWTRFLEEEGSSASFFVGQPLMEVPDHVSLSALALAVVAGGAVKTGKTTVLMSPEEGLEAMRPAGGTGSRLPGG